MKGGLFGFLKGKKGPKAPQPEGLRMERITQEELEKSVANTYRCKWYVYFPNPDQVAGFLEIVLKEGYDLGDSPEPVWKMDDGIWSCAVCKDTNVAGEDSFIESVSKRFGGDYDGWEAAVGTPKENPGKNFDWKKALGIS